jgi:hypothetical protein
VLGRAPARVSGDSWLETDVQIGVANHVRFFRKIDTQIKIDKEA